MSRPAAVELLESFAELMGRLGLRWYVFGAQAVISYGRPRLTADVDVAVDARRCEPGRLLRELEASAFVPRARGFDDVIVQSRVWPLLHEPTSLPLDLALIGDGLERAFLRRARTVSFGGLRIPMMSIEDLVAVKILANRRKDLDDVVGILMQSARAVDLRRVRNALLILEKGAGASGLLASLDRLLTEAMLVSGEPVKARPKRRRS